MRSDSQCNAIEPHSRTTWGPRPVSSAERASGRAEPLGTTCPDEQNRWEPRVRSRGKVTPKSRRCPIDRGGPSSECASGGGSPCRPSHRSARPRCAPRRPRPSAGSPGSETSGRRSCRAPHVHPRSGPDTRPLESPGERTDQQDGPSGRRWVASGQQTHVRPGHPARANRVGVSVDSSGAYLVPPLSSGALWHRRPPQPPVNGRSSSTCSTSNGDGGWANPTPLEYSSSAIASTSSAPIASIIANGPAG